MRSMLLAQLRRLAWLTCLAVALAVLPARAEEELEETRPDFEESIEVLARLGASGPRRESEQVASVEVHEGEDIRASGSRSLPEYLARCSGLVAVDEVGNGRQLSIDLRGFSSASGSGGTAVLVDGLRLNDPDTGYAALELLRVEDIERIEIRKGPLGQLLGGGALAGAIHVIRKPPADRKELQLRQRLGSQGLLGLDLQASVPLGDWRLLASAAREEGEGHRDDADFRETAARVELQRAHPRWRLGLGLSAFSGRWRQPGALARSEYETDPWQSLANALDYTDTERLEAHARLRDLPGGSWDWSLLLSQRRRLVEVLTTGRAPGSLEPSGLGFLTRDALDASALVAETVWRPLPERSEALELRLGLDLARERMSPRGFATTDLSLDDPPPSLAPFSELDVDWDREALLGGLVARKGQTMLELGLRHDASRVRRAGRQQGSAGWEESEDERSFSESTWGLGLARHFERSRFSGEVRLAWASSYLAPSSLQLFAFPGFESNPDLAPQRGEGVTLGSEWRGATWSASAEIFSTELKDEILFDLVRLQNVNVGKTRRRGAELQFRARPHARLGLNLAWTRTQAAFRSGYGDGAKGDLVPLIPEQQWVAGVEFGPFPCGTFRLDLRHVGRRPLGNDFNNDSAPLGSHSLVDLDWRRVQSLSRGSLELSLSIANLFDELHALRGIEDPRETFLTPGPPRSATLALAWVFP